MPISKELAELLACPKCKGELAYPEGVEEIRCLSCRLAYRIEDGIPVMLIEESRSLESE